MVGVTNGLSNLGTLREILDSPAVQIVSAPYQSSLASPSSSVSINGQLGSANNTDGAPALSNLVAPVTMIGVTPVGGTMRVTFVGAPSSSYRIERASSLGSSSWEVVGSATADGLGNGEFTDLNPPAVQAFYRTKQ